MICKDFLRNKCNYGDNCKYDHPNPEICTHYLQNKCRYGEKCHKKHEGEPIVIEKPKVNKQEKYDREKQKREEKRKLKNTTVFTPLDRPVDIRIVYDIGTKHLSKTITTRDVVLVPNLFTDFPSGQLYTQLLNELKESGIEKESLFKIWHGNDKIEGTHLIANDKTDWKTKSPTFEMITNRIVSFFNMTIEATRLNWYPDTSTYKSFHHDSAYVNPKKAKIQNFTVAISFGATRDCAFQRVDQNQNIISIPIADGEIYCFSKDTNVLWKHGVLQDSFVRNEGRISCIFWGKIEHQQVLHKPKTTPPDSVVQNLKNTLEHNF